MNQQYYFSITSTAFPQHFVSISMLHRSTCHCSLFRNSSSCSLWLLSCPNPNAAGFPSHPSPLSYMRTQVFVCEQEQDLCPPLSEYLHFLSRGAWDTSLSGFGDLFYPAICGKGEKTQYLWLGDLLEVVSGLHGILPPCRLQVAGPSPNTRTKVGSEPVYTILPLGKVASSHHPHPQCFLWLLSEPQQRTPALLKPLCRSTFMTLSLQISLPYVGVLLFSKNKRSQIATFKKPSGSSYRLPLADPHGVLKLAQCDCNNYTAG